MAQADGTITLHTNVDTSGVKKGANTIKSALNGLSGTLFKFTSAIGVAFGVGQLIRFGKEAVKLASDVEEVQNVVDVAFGDMAYKMEAFSRIAIETYGISQLTAKRTGSTYMAMAKGMGIAEDAASDMSLVLTGLTADMASFYNISQEEADTAIKSIFTGETETLKRYGIVMTQVNLQEYARQQGITKNISKMTQQEQVMLRYKYVLQQTALAQGDFARTYDSWANQTRILSETWKEMQIEFGQAFKTVATLVLPAVNSLIRGLTHVAQVARIAAQNIASFFGREINTESKSVADNAESMSNSTGTTSDNMEDVTDATKKTNKETKKLLASFDDLSILSESVSKDLDNKPIDFGDLPTSGIESIGDSKFDPNGYALEVNAALELIMAYAGVALVGIGLILLFFGQVGWGIGFIIAGVITFEVVKYSAIMQDHQEVIDALRKILKAAGSIMASVGLVLLFFGHIGWGIGLILEGIAVFGASEFVGERLNIDFIKENLDIIFKIMGELACAVGLLLIFLGNTPVGIGFIVVGIAFMGVSEFVGEKFTGEQITAKLLELSQVISEALCVIGVILLFLGHIPAGIGFIVAGMALMNVTEIAEGGFDKEKIQEFLFSLLDTISKSMLVIGVILLVLGQTLKGLAAIILGLTLMELPEIVSGDESIEEKVNKVITVLMESCGKALLVLGVILIVFKQYLKGILALAAGISLLQLSQENDGGKDIITLIDEFIVKLMEKVMLAAVALGVVLIMAGQIPLGIAALVFGALQYFQMVAINSGALNEKLIPWLTKLNQIIMGFSLVLGIILLFSGNIVAGLAFLALAGTSFFINKQMEGLDGSAVKEQLSSELSSINDEAKQGVDEINNTLSGISFSGQSNYAASTRYSSSNNKATFSVPKLANGTVIPPNKEFLAVLGDQKSGTNVEAPLSTIKQAVAEAMGENGGGNQTVILQIDGREFGRVALDQMNRESKRVGASIFSV